MNDHQEQTVEDGIRQKCSTILQNALGSEEFWVSMHAAEALTLAGQQDFVRTSLESRLLSERDDRKRSGLARELFRAGDDSAVSILQEILGKSDTYAHVHAMESLYKIGQIGGGGANEQAAKQPLDNRLTIWESAALAKHGDDGALAVLNAYLDNQDPLAKSLSGYLLGQLGDDSQINKIRRNYLNTQEPIQRFLNIAALIYLGDVEVHTELERYLLHADAGIRSLAANLLAETRLESYRHVLLKNLGDPDLDVRVRSADAILRL